MTLKKTFDKSDPYIIGTYNQFTDKLRSRSEEEGVPFVGLSEDKLPIEKAKNINDRQYFKSWKSFQETNDYICACLLKL